MSTLATKVRSVKAARPAKTNTRPLPRVDIAAANARLEAFAQDRRDRRAELEKRHAQARLLATRVLERLNNRLDSDYPVRCNWIFLHEITGHYDWSTIMEAGRLIRQSGLRCVYKTHAQAFRISIPRPQS